MQAPAMQLSWIVHASLSLHVGPVIGS